MERKLYGAFEPINRNLDVVKRKLIDAGQGMREKLYNVYQFMRRQQQSNGGGDKGGKYIFDREMTPQTFFYLFPVILFQILLKEFFIVDFNHFGVGVIGGLACHLS